MQHTQEAMLVSKDMFMILNEYFFEQKIFYQIKEYKIEKFFFYT